jgi:hypothetical protein
MTRRANRRIAVVRIDDPAEMADSIAQVLGSRLAALELLEAAATFLRSGGAR